MLGKRGEATLVIISIASYKTKHILTILTSNLTLVRLSQKNENLYTQKPVHECL